MTLICKHSKYFIQSFEGGGDGRGRGKVGGREVFGEVGGEEIIFLNEKGGLGLVFQYSS